MGIFKRQQKATASIQFVNHRKEDRQSPQWTSDDTIEGKVVFRLPPDAPLTRANVILKGVVSTHTNESTPASLQPNWRDERVKFLSVGKELHSGSRSRFVDGVLELPFRFNLRDCSLHSSLDSGLPPSLDSKTDRHEHGPFHKQDSRAAYDITYTVTTSASSTRGLIVSTTEKISILPLGQPEPPSYGSAEVAGEYFTATTSNSRNKVPLSKKGARHVDVAAQEPSPLVMRPQSGAAEPLINVSMLLKITSEDSHALAKLPQQAHIRTQLISKTQISPNGARSDGPERRTRHDLDSQSRYSKSNTQDCTLALPTWEQYQPGGGTPAFAIARLSFLYRHPQTERLPPTFSTPILSRHYDLEVKVSFPEDGGQSVKLSLPVQVMYETAGAGAGGRVEDAGDVLERKASSQSCFREIPQAVL